MWVLIKITTSPNVFATAKPGTMANGKVINGIFVFGPRLDVRALRITTTMMMMMVVVLVFGVVVGTFMMSKRMTRGILSLGLDYNACLSCER